MTRARRVTFDFFWEHPRVRHCDEPGCEREGVHRAPRSRARLDDFYWFCLEHVRAYNARWDFFAGMTEAEIEAFRDADVIGHRPTWPMGAIGRVRAFWASHEAEDLFEVFGRGPRDRDGGEARRPRTHRDALAAMNLPTGASVGDIKRRFKALVKRYHPDANGGDRGAEERLRVVIEAYRVLVRGGAG